MAFVVVQELIVSWGKDQRGGKAAAERNALPEASLIPDFTPPAHSLTLVHDKVTLDAGTKHRLTVDEFDLYLKSIFGCVWIAWDQSVVSVTYAYNYFWGGAPKRTAYPRKVLKLSLGEWGRIVYNGRFSNSEGGPWRYNKSVFNIGYFRTLEHDAFLSTPPRIFSDMADLW